MRISDWSSDVCSSDLEFNLGSPKQRVDKLQQLGWIPREFTEKGFPRPFDKGKLSPSLEEFLEENPKAEVELIAKWMSINGRANMVNTWLNEWNEADNRSEEHTSELQSLMRISYAVHYLKKKNKQIKNK